MQKQIYFVSHCILNNASKVESSETSALIQEEKLRKTFLNNVISNDIALIQLPCPETLMYGLKRWGHVREQFDNPFFKKHSETILEPIVQQIIEYSSQPDKFSILGIIGISGSPSCGINLTCSGSTCGGEFSDLNSFSKKINSITTINKSGIFMDVLKSLLNKNNLNIKLFDLA